MFRPNVTMTTQQPESEQETAATGKRGRMGEFERVSKTLILEALTEAGKVKGAGDKGHDRSKLPKIRDPKARALVLAEGQQRMREHQMTLFEVAPWADDMRGIPNAFARSALFSTRNKREKRGFMQQQRIFNVGSDYEITYTGAELRATDDELVWQQVIDYSKRVPVGEVVSFTFYQLCKDLGWQINGAYYKKAEECLTRLQASAMQFYSSRIGRLESLSLIRRFRIVDKGSRQSSRCEVEIDEEMLRVFGNDQYTRVIWVRYRELSPTARRLFDYAASHRKPYPIKLETFREMCGSDSDRPNKWKEQVNKACKELEQSNLVDGAWIDKKGLIYCRRR